jgi:hypothetical protein
VLSTCHGSIARSGNSGSTIAAAGGEQQRIVQLLLGEHLAHEAIARAILADSSRVTATPSPAASATSRIASTPSRNTTSIAISVVNPGSRERLYR